MIYLCWLFFLGGGGGFGGGALFPCMGVLALVTCVPFSTIIGPPIPPTTKNQTRQTPPPLTTNHTHQPHQPNPLSPTFSPGHRCTKSRPCKYLCQGPHPRATTASTAPSASAFGGVGGQKREVSGAYPLYQTHLYTYERHIDTYKRTPASVHIRATHRHATQTTSPPPSCLGLAGL